MNENWVELMAAKVCLYRQQRDEGTGTITRKDKELAKKYLSRLENHKDLTLVQFLEEQVRR